MQGESLIDYKKTVCPLDCPDTCGMIAKVVDGRVVSLTGDPDHPYTKGFICRKMRSYPDRLYDRNRILHPMIRDGQKGQGKFRRISWQEAIKLFAGKLLEVKEQYGGEAILPYQYAGNMGVINRNGGYALYHKLGTSRLLETICSAAAGKGWAMHLGDTPGSPPEIATDSDLIVAWGINVRVSNVHFWQYIASAKKRGGKLLVIDPYLNETGRLADHYIRVLPGGDGALALGLIKVLIEDGALDRTMLAEQTNGFEVLEQYIESVEWSELVDESGVSKSAMEQLAKLLKSSPKTFIRIGIGLSRNSRGGMSVRSIVSLAAALGLFGGGEGKGVLLSSKAYGGDTDKLRFPELSAAETRVVNMARLGHALTRLEPPVKLLSVYSSNPISIAPDATMVEKGLMRDDLFTVVHEQVMSPTARYADLLLPATTFLENRDLYTGYGHFYLGCVDRVVEPRGEAKSNFDFFQLVARELGFDEEPFNQTVEDRLGSYAGTIEGLPDDFGFDPGKFSGWVKSTRARYGQSIREQFGAVFDFVARESDGKRGHARILRAVEFSDPDLSSRYPFKLIIPPHRDLLNSTFGERYEGKPGDLLIHPQDAASRSVQDGDEVRLLNFRGSSPRIARVTTDTQPGLLVAEGIYWQLPQQAGINGLVSQKITDVGEGPTFHESLVDVEVVARG